MQRTRRRTGAQTKPWEHSGWLSCRLKRTANGTSLGYVGKHPHGQRTQLFGLPQNCAELLVKPDATRWFLTPSLAVLALGLALVPLASGSIATTAAVALVAASAAILSPIVTYWVSLSAGETEGADLERFPIRMHHIRR
jgi:hypothetical protein